ncbi:MAG: hypothetical protein J6O04_06400 [Selenomonadaceae bacterium]|nr:hypothetical protein [Selenomonadaceae bacterium]
MYTDTRYISIKESLEGACKEVHQILESKAKGITYEEVKARFKAKYGDDVVFP